jgi:predicted TIM-barrel fold metal-dependent hydrolase
MPPESSSASPRARREFLRTTLGVTAAIATVRRSSGAAPVPASTTGLTDTNVWLGQWPIRRLTLDEPAALTTKLKANGVTRGWAASFDGILHKDVAAVNARLMKTCRQHPLFEPVGIINPSLPRWERDVESCAAVHQMKAIRLVPGYHGLELDSPRFVEVLKLATANRLAVQLTLILEDERTQNPLLRAVPPKIAGLPKAMQAVPGARVMVLNWTRAMAGKPVLMALEGANLLFDIGMLEGISGIEAALEELPLERLCFGSYAPVFYHEAAKLKLQESELTDAQLQAITHRNAERFLQG